MATANFVIDISLETTREFHDTYMGYDFLGTNISGIVVCYECFALVPAQEMYYHADWHLTQKEKEDK